MALSVVLNEMTGQFSQVIKPLFKTDLTLRTLRMLTFGPNENTIIGKSSRVEMIERIIVQKMSGRMMNKIGDSPSFISMWWEIISVCSVAKTNVQKCDANIGYSMSSVQNMSTVETLLIHTPRWRIQAMGYERLCIDASIYLRTNTAPVMGYGSFDCNLYCLEYPI